MDKRLIQIAVIAMFLYCRGAEGFACYSCTYTDNISGVGYECVTNPANYTEGPSTVECVQDDICFMEETISKFNEQVDYLVRGCGYRVDGCEEDNYERRCTYTCTSHELCNNWNANPAATTKSTTPSSTNDPNSYIDCYSCSYVRDATGDESCLYEPALQNTIKCYGGNLCYVFESRQSGTGDILAFERQCGNQFQGSDCVVDSYGEHCHDTCYEPLCNDHIAAADTLHIGSSLVLALAISLFLT